MTIHQIHFGKKFYLDHQTGYWISTACPKIRAHQWVWINYHKVIPKGYHIHHINDDKSDNRIENLELIHGSRHVKYHMNLPERIIKSKEIMQKISPLSKEWHASDEGRAWHKYYAQKSNFGKWEPKKYKCQVCNSEYETSKRSNIKFCSNACKSRYRRASGLDNVDRECENCKKKFNINKYKKTRFCSISCGKHK